MSRRLRRRFRKRIPYFLELHDRRMAKFEGEQKLKEDGMKRSREELLSRILAHVISALIVIALTTLIAQVAQAWGIAIVLH